MPAILWLIAGATLVFVAGGLEAVGIVAGELCIAVGLVIAWSHAGDVDG